MILQVKSLIHRYSIAEGAEYFDALRSAWINKKYIYVDIFE